MMKNNLLELDSYFTNNYDFATLISWAKNNKIQGIGYYDKSTMKEIGDFYTYGNKIYNSAYFIQPDIFIPAMIKSLEESKYSKVIARESGKKYPLGRVYKKLLEIRYELFEKQDFIARFETKDS